MHFIHCGCKVNQYETNAMIQQFLENGYQVVPFEQMADIYIINTCTVTNMSDRKSRQMLRRAKEKNPQAILVACGCYAQVAKEELEKIPEIDIVLGTNEKNQIISHIKEFAGRQKAMITDVMAQKEFLDFGSVTFTEKTRAVIKVQDGCDRFCSYCIIPYARGRVRSRKIENVISEVKQIVAKGIKEVVITGIHIASYGKDLKGQVSLIDLLEELNKVEYLQRIRLGSLEPTIITEEFVERLTKLDKICQHFHLSLQSGCNETLARMNRKYTIEEFTEVVNRLRKAYPEVVLTTDIIVGFPGETEEEFRKTFDFLQDIQFYKMHIFQYSPRKGTKAATMQEQVDSKTKEERSKKLIILSNQNESARLEKEIGTQKEVLFEQKEGEYQKGHTQNYLEVAVKTEKKLENTIQLVNIISQEKMKLIGVVIGDGDF